MRGIGSTRMRANLAPLDGDVGACRLPTRASRLSERVLAPRELFEEDFLEPANDVSRAIGLPTALAHEGGAHTELALSKAEHLLACSRVVDDSVLHEQDHEILTLLVGRGGNDLHRLLSAAGIETARAWPRHRTDRASGRHRNPRRRVASNSLEARARRSDTGLLRVASQDPVLCPRCRRG